MIISLIRHGMTDANARRLYCGRTDLDLCEPGITELIILKNEIDYPAGEIYATSGLKRAVSTLRILYGPVLSVSIPELAEYNFGDFEMKSHDELQHEKRYADWIDNEDIRCPNGESRTEFYQRIKTGFNKLKIISGTVVCVCHGGVIASLMDFLFPGQKNFYEWQPRFGRGYAISAGVDIDYEHI